MWHTGKRIKYKLRNGDIVTAFEFKQNSIVRDPTYVHMYVPLEKEETFIKCEIEWKGGKGLIPYGMPHRIHDKDFDITHVFNEETQEFEEF
jgi:hypothetical protein